MVTIIYVVFFMLRQKIQWWVGSFQILLRDYEWGHPDYDDYDDISKQDMLFLSLHLQNLHQV